MTKQKVKWSRLLPVFLSFVVMGFVDIIGVAISYIKQDFDLTNFAAQFLPMMVLLWLKSTTGLIFRKSSVRIFFS